MKWNISVIRVYKIKYEKLVAMSEYLQRVNNKAIIWNNKLR